MRTTQLVRRLTPPTTSMMSRAAFLLATILLAGCTSDEFIGDQSLADANGQTPITFSSGVPAVTRADKAGSEAATDLGNRFIVWGEKNEGDGKTATEAKNLVFPNYQVNYVSNSAYTTTSNTKDWEYVGMGHSANHRNNIKTKAGAAEAVTAQSAVQTIKYWDYGATNYVFTAVSADSTNINNNDVTITKNTMEATNGKYKKGYTITLTANADPSKVFISDRCEITSSSNTNRNEPNKYGGNVTLKFRNLLSHIRVGMYETIPGYTVTISKFYYTDAANPAFTAMTTERTEKFYANVPSVATTSAATLTVTYHSEETTKNQPTISISGTTASNYITLGGADDEKTGLKATAKLAETATAPTFNETSGAYTAVYPQEANSTNLKLKLDYILTSPTGETIEVKGATAEIPAQYLQWKPNYKYTYLFKISDNTNGSTGQSVTGLYPITFDAVEVVAEDGQAEYITTVSEPSITTFGYDATNSKYITGGNEYPAGSDVYATIMDGSSLATLSGSNMKLYTVTTTDATNFPITEASVAEALIEGPTLTKAQAEAAKIKCTAGSLNYQNTVPAEDGTTTTLHASEYKAATFTTAASTTYALVYQKTAAEYTYDEGKNDYTSETFTAAGTLYTRTGSEPYTYVKADTWSDGNTYYKRTAVSSKGVYAVKIVRVTP